jgi:uncharacterized protein YggU (UPF0235/DUF167 family)
VSQPASRARPWTRTPSGIRLILRLTPRGGRDALGGVRLDAAGRAQLLARVASPPVEGAANAALVRLVAKALRIPKSAVTIAAGETSRIKTLEIVGDPAKLERALEDLES